MPVVIEHTLAILEHENDSRCISEVLSDIPVSQYIMIADKNMNCENLKWIYGQCDYIIGTRFHSVIFSLSQGVPAIAITYGGNKGEGIMKDMGLSEYAVNIEDINEDKIKELFKKLVRNEDSVKEKINNYIENSNENRKIMINEMRECME